MDHMNIAVYVTGSVACYKTLILIRMLKRRGANVRIIMSNGAQQFIKPLPFQALSGHSVIREQAVNPSTHGIPHVDLARWTDVAIIMPATANVIAKMANGIADGIVSTCLLATSAPKIIVPAMNNLMFINPATQRNLRLLKGYPNYYQWGPTYGKLAEGYPGKGRMIEPKQVINKLGQLLNRHQFLHGLRLLVTAGGTEEPIDPVRFITNGSSGKMGYAVAERAHQMGADVTLISGHANIPVPSGIKVIKVQTTEDMGHAVLDQYPKADALVMSAALADFEPVHMADQKIKKGPSSHHMILKLKRTPDVLKRVAKIKKSGQLTIGFAAETQNLIDNATHKLKAKKLDLIVANDVSNPKIGFGGDNNQVTFIDRNGHQQKTPVESKLKVADQLLKIIAKLKG
ncbi:bifunctional phosphopantothenoylcysteine decarboxylase/phosphopantothenate--cysteine ligase CoaBC [Acetilactobacillus jinshanensis]|uniref:Coenzyme A biosynthesis bifunctional protein CoaBC n=1 Tax=Acetilactobacillus jinshanensis TaxID=1720083 RepID=A0A4P6ZLQ6_9LACO|nr:bifunctional phosphopantothenoylcysteine decarboxylase/phosphopantothenate--cysteine ligase CoaBC [Acetilactobacillus jinshanensis]QBP18628.1 bifunctional phosphopantothenoylcysteine decarboxylase/phosphopantothenate--cysteine ligase CoaBC [Acetilactobacillus jinshanensis]URL61504.1 bifunctional phosphopantothenoylcysteine decarboxylase/phosphopantothenate--cysteine ligase CoaBC [uncultured bacterium]